MEEQSPAASQQAQECYGKNKAGCAACLKAAPEGKSLRRCADCHETLYCDRDCQKADWKSHKKQCKSTAGSAGGPNTKRKPTSFNPNGPSPTNAFNMPLPGIVSIGPVTTVGPIRDAKPGDPKPEFTEHLYNAIPEEIVRRCNEILQNHETSKKGDKATK